MTRRAFLLLAACASLAPAWPKRRGLWLSPPWRALPGEYFAPGTPLALVAGSPAAMTALAARLTPPPAAARVWLLHDDQPETALALGARRCPTDAAFAEACRALGRDWYGAATEPPPRRAEKQGAT